MRLIKMRKAERQKVKMRLNTINLMEETAIRLKLAKADDLFKLQFLACFRPNASLRQINNVRQINFK